MLISHWREIAVQFQFPWNVNETTFKITPVTESRKFREIVQVKEMKSPP